MTVGNWVVRTSLALEMVQEVQGSINPSKSIFRLVNKVILDLSQAPLKEEKVVFLL